MSISSEYKCPDCGDPIQHDDINIAQDIGLCRACGTALPFGELIDSKEEAQILSSLPKYLTVEKTTQGITITYKRKGIFTAIFILIVIVQLFIISSFMIPGMIGKFSLFWIPFILIEVIILSIAIFFLFAKSVITVSPGKGNYFTGVGKIKLSRQFYLTHKTKFGEKTISYSNFKQVKAMTINTLPHKKITIGHFIPENTYPYLKAIFRQWKK